MRNAATIFGQALKGSVWVERDRVYMYVLPPSRPDLQIQGKLLLFDLKKSSKNVKK
jgi:hypothetical protein